MPNDNLGNRQWYKDFGEKIERWKHNYADLDPGLRQAAEDLRQGAIDFHVHCDPSAVLRTADSLEVAEQCAAAGMRAIVIKDHHCTTEATAWLAQKHAHLGGDFEIFGSTWLNNFVGGYNVFAVDRAIIFGARLIAAPTVSSWGDRERATRTGRDAEKFPPEMLKRQRLGMAERLIHTIDDDGRLLPEVIEVLDRIAEEDDVVLGSGHLSKREAVAFADGAHERGIERICLTHFQSFTGADVNETHELCRRTNAVAEYCSAHVLELGDQIPEVFRAVGIENITYSTDAGFFMLPPPAELYAMGIAAMLRTGLSEEEIVAITRVNPARLLGIEVSNAAAV